jgi:hypothetical protein
MTYRVIQWATGGVGRAAVEGIASHPELELVGTWVHSAAKAGRDVGEICGLEPIGVTATQDIDELLALDADCVLYAPITANRNEVIRILESGKNVVTPLGWFYPRSDDGADLEAACRKRGVTLHGTGIHPGGMTERIPLILSAFSRSVTHVRSEEFSDIRTYGAPDVLEKVMLFGGEPEDVRSSPVLQLLGEGFFQSIDMVADALGLTLDPEKRTTLELAVATKPIPSPIGDIQPGLVAGQRFTWQGTVGGTPVVTARVNWLMGEENLDPPMSFGPEGTRYEIEIEGDPPLYTVIHGCHPASIEAGLQRNPGIVTTAIHCVSAIPYVCEAKPGIVSYLDLPLVAGRAAPELLEKGS